MQKKSGTILLVSCYELGHPPFGIARLASQLAGEGLPTDILDLAVETLDTQKVSRAALIGISVPMHTALRIGVAAADAIRKINPNARIVFFGLYAVLNKPFLLENAADFVVEGEDEKPFLDLAKNIITPIEGKAVGSCALPPLSQYAHLERDGMLYPVGYVEASRGCRHLCRHCPIPPVYGGRFNVLPESIVLESIRDQVARGGGGAAHITFGDPDFLNGPNHSLKILRKMHQEFPQITFDFTAKIEHLLKRQDLLPEFAALGCIFIVSAVESLNDTVLHHLDKGHTRVDVIRVLEVVHGAGIALRPSLVPFTPWETLESYLDLFDFVERYQLIDHIDPVQYTVRLLVPPGSLLLSEPSMTPYLGPLIPDRFTYPWTHPDPRMDRLQKEVCKTVEAMVEADAEVTFYQLKELAHAAHKDRTAVQIMRQIDSNRRRPPRLTESWFCCSEPTENQMISLDCLNEGQSQIAEIDGQGAGCAPPPKASPLSQK